MGNKKILMLIQSGYSARNFILSGFLDGKELNFTFWSDQDYIEQYGINNKLIKLPDYDYYWKINFIQRIKNKAELFYNVKKTANKNYLFYLASNGKSFRIRIKDFLTTLIAKIYANKKGIKNLDKPFHRAVRKTNYYKSCKEQLIKEKPDVVFCTHQRASMGVAPMLAARDLKIKTVCFIHSWDNIPKGVQLVKTDYYFVWSHYMKKEMLFHYPFINGDKVFVTGTPQFMCYENKEYQIPRKQFYKEFGLDDTKRYILFSGNDKTTSPNDPVYLADICKSVKDLNKDKDLYRVLFRPNPIDRNEGFNTVLEAYSNTVIEIKPDWFGTDIFLWNQGGPNKRDVFLLVNTIVHSDLVVNMGSTMAIDAAILGVPSCYINYDVPSSYNWSVSQTYQFIHFKMINDIEPIFWIKNRNELTSVLKQALETPDKTLADRQQWIERITELPIAKTNKRMWKYLKDIYEI